MTLPAVVVLCGPTAIGKTALACALTERLPLSLISVDSAQIYLGMDIGTGKPSPTEQKRYPHALIDIRSPDRPYSAAEFCHDATAAINCAHADAKLPLLVGGTMMYLQALIRGLAELPRANPEVRADIDEMAERHGWPYCHARLRELDPLTAARLAANDSQRIQRALEVWMSTGKTLSAWLAEPQAPSPFRFLLLGLVPQQRKTLHEAIATRFENMLRQGLIDEVIALKNRYPLTADTPSMRAVGYRQVWQYLAGEYAQHNLIERATAATRQLAKRQLTWISNSLSVETLPIDDLKTQLDLLLDQICQRINRFVPLS